MDKITIISQQHYCCTIPLAVPLLRVTSTITSSVAILLSDILTAKEVSFSDTEYWDWLNETVVNIHC